MTIKKLDRKYFDKAIILIEKVFMECEAPDYSDEGVRTFKETAIYNDEYLNQLEMYGAYNNNTLVGVIATRSEGSHIALFFVDGKYHRQGIGRMLFNEVLKHTESNYITVNSSPYAQCVYHKLGFVDTDKQQSTNGLIYTPMKYKK